MASGLINANPVVYERKERQVRSVPTIIDEDAEELIDQQEIFDYIRDIQDPEHPYTLEELKVVTEDSIEVNDKKSHVSVAFTPTVEHCSLATTIGLCLRVKLMRSLPSRYKDFAGEYTDVTLVWSEHFMGMQKSRIFFDTSTMSGVTSLIML